MKPEDAKKLVEDSGESNKTYLGTRTSKLGVEENIGIKDTDRILHTLNTGKTGAGKTQLMIHAALQDSYKDHGFCLLNPKGGAIKQILSKLPEDRVDDIIYINPTSKPIPSINVLEPHITEEMTKQEKENQKEIIVSDLIDLFKRQSKNWGDQFGRILETFLRAHLNQNIYHNQSNSLMDIYHCIINENNELQQLIQDCQDPAIQKHLEYIKNNLSQYEMGPLQRRVNDFVTNTTTREVIAAQESIVNFRKAVNQGKIILVDIQKGEIGATASELIGSIIITKIWAAAQSRITQNPEDRVPFYLYVDELQNFGSEGSALANMLSEAREYRLGCWLATQYLSRLDTTMRRAVINNCRSKIIFNPTGSDNENKISGLLNQITKNQLKALQDYQAALTTPGKTALINTLPPWNTDDENDISQIKDQQTPSNGLDLGPGDNAGGEKHTQLLQAAEEELEQRGGVHVEKLYQNPGDDKPDAKVTLPNGETAHLEAEHTTLTKPKKVLKNLQRGHKQERTVIFAVQQGHKNKLENILNKTEQVENADYKILEITLETDSSPKCPELENSTKEELKGFCLHRREDGHCTELDQPCVLQE